MVPSEDKKFIEVIPYRNTPIQVALACLLFVPTSIFIIYTPFRNPCSLDRKSGDCSLGSPFAEQIYTYGMVGLGILTIFFCLFLIQRYRRSKIPKKGCRIAFTEDSVIGPIWGFWSSPEGEIKFSEINELTIVQTKYGPRIHIVSPSKQMILQISYLNEGDSFKRVYNHLAHKLSKPLFEDIASSEVIGATLSFSEQMEGYKHLFASFFYFLIGAVLTLLFGDYSSRPHSENIDFFACSVALAGFIYIGTTYFKKFWESEIGPMIIFGFLTFSGAFLVFIGTVGLLSF